ncbi:TetR/AcrR family transcriptional regulator C-terminal domain-containing protein [Streptomyces carpaticus]|uniref:TetR/AcrR family transcriptional regulator C-terminal domain-containing protein n=1 Tax=Streptomyces carpaticus TaxID=285558 RepID=UPI0031FA26C9
MPRPRSLTPQHLATAALTVIDRDGLAGLSMRAVATELGIATMSLYRYVPDREALERQVVDLVLAGVDTAPPAGQPWQRQLAGLLERVRTAVAAHPGAVPLTVTHRHTSEAVRQWSETVLGVLAAAGFSPRRRALALRALLAYLTGALQNEHLAPLTGEATTALAELPPDAYPLLSGTASEAARVPAAEEFRAGLDLLLSGLSAAPR